MFREESLWIKNAINKIHAVFDANEVANIGSSTGHFRQVIQPHIHQNIMAPLHQLGWKVTHVDVKQDEGVDLVEDVTNRDFSKNYTNRFGLTICTNLLEHVEDINLVIKNLADITHNNGYILITVPYKYKLHYDPIDNGFRPTPFEIASRFLNLGVQVTIVDENIISIQDIEYYRIKKSNIPLWGYRERFQYYLGRRHKVAGILLKLEKSSTDITKEKKVYFRGLTKYKRSKSAKNLFLF